MAHVVDEIETIFENKEPSVPERVERGHVAAIEAAANAGATDPDGQLQFSRRSGPQPRVGFHERGAAVDVEQHHGLAWTQDGVWPASSAAGGAARFGASFVAFR